MTAPKRRGRKDFAASISLRCPVTVLVLCIVYCASTIFWIDASSSIHGRQSLEKEASLFLETNQYALAKEQSFGFFTDIPIETWNMMKQRVHEAQPNMACGPNCSGALDPMSWYQENYEPEFSCLHERRIGKMGDGGKWVCDPHRLVNKSCLIYSVGSRGDFSFETHALGRLGSHCEIHTFDINNHTRQADKVNSSRLHFHHWGIGKTNEAKFKTLNETVHELGHANRTIDIFKIDCDGCEFETFETWITDQPAMLHQILVEVHAKKPTPTRYGQKVSYKVHMDKHLTREDVEVTTSFFKRMHEYGYAIFHKEPNIQYWCDWPAVEYAFIKLHHDFFSK